MAAGTGERSGESLRGSGSGKHASGLDAENAGVNQLHQRPKLGSAG
jgi:hypothetical protein